MVRELHVIVHKGIVEHCASKSLVAKKAWENIQRIMATESYLEIHGNPNIPHPDIPIPTDDLVVLVSGAMTTNCVEKQWFALGELGYRSRINHDACYEQSSDYSFPQRY